MSFLAEWRARLAGLLFRGREERETSEELRFHLDMATERELQSGHSPDEARRRALVAFGGVERTREAVRDARGGRLLGELLQDLRYAARRLFRTPGFTAVAVLTLALGIGANTAIFSVVDGVLLRALPFTDARQLVMVWGTDRSSSTTREPVSWPDYQDLAAGARTLDGAAALMGNDLTITPDQGDPVRAAGMLVSAGYFPLVGVQPLIGRGFTPEDDQPNGPRVAVLGEAEWRTLYAADPDILGRRILVNELPYTVIGVVRRGADFGLDQIHARAAYHAPYIGTGEVGVWLPLQANEDDLPRSTHPILMLGRLAPGASATAAQRELGTIAARLEETYPGANAARGVHVEPLTQVVFGPTRPMMLLLLGAVTLVLLVACVNVANLLLARGAARAREVAVRGALGAGFGRLSRQFLTESVLLALLGGAAGIGLAVGGLKLLLALAPADVPRLDQVSIDLRVLLVTIGVSLAVGLAFGVVPTVQAFHVDIMRTIRGESPGGSASTGARRFREGLVVAELALSVTLVVAAGLLIRSFWSVLQINPGYRAAGVVKAEFRLPATRYPADFRVWPAWKEVHAFDRALLERVRAIPGVEAAAIANVDPLNAGFTNSFVVVGREPEAANWPEISLRIVSPDYFQTLGVSVLRGRGLEAGDDASAPPVAVINQATVNRFFAGQDPIGQEIRFWGANRRIVGVVGDELIHGITQPAPIATYIPVGQAPRPGVVFARTSGDPAPLVAELRRAIHETDPQLAVFAAEPLSVTLQQSIAERRFAMLVLITFAGLTFTLALVGIHGVLSYTTTQRTREIGIRLALGATRRGVTRLVMFGGLRLAALGTTLGLVGAAAASQLLGGLLYGVQPVDPTTFGAVGLVALVAALCAIWLPANRAARVAPILCLRAE